jgi:hypothetical protein
MNTLKPIKNQQGAALVVGLILLVVVTVLAISGMNTATTELAMARNDQNYENAFQAAESGIEQALSLGAVSTAAPVTMTYTPTSHESVTTTVQFEDASPVPDQAFSLGAGSQVSAYHFVATSVAQSKRAPGSTTDRDSTSTITQAFYVVGPGSPTL